MRVSGENRSSSELYTLRCLNVIIESPCSYETTILMIVLRNPSLKIIDKRNFALL